MHGFASLLLQLYDQWLDGHIIETLLPDRQGRVRVAPDAPPSDSQSVPGLAQVIVSPSTSTCPSKEVEGVTTVPVSRKRSAAPT